MVAMSQPEEAMKKCKTVVYKQRIRLRDFFVDFDKLRTGLIFENQFLMGLSMSGMNKYIKSSQLQSLADGYKVAETDKLNKVDYRRFCDDVDTVFTLKDLEKSPLKEVPAEPTELLDKTRYQFSSKVLSPAKEDQLAVVLERLRKQCRMKGILVKPFFDDAAHDVNSCMLVNHVTIPQFKQCLNVKLGLMNSLAASDADLLVEKYVDDEYGDMVNYVCFSQSIDPPQH